MQTYTISYSTALRSWVLQAGSPEGKSTVIHAGFNPHDCLSNLGAIAGFDQKTKVAIMFDNEKAPENPLPDLVPFNNDIKGRASRAALRSYATILREHGDKRNAEILEDISKDAENEILERIR